MNGLFAEIFASADLLGLSRESAAVKRSMQTAQIAIEEGYGEVLALDLALSALRSAAEHTSTSAA